MHKEVRMLIRFKVANCLSFKDETSLEMFASSHSKLNEQLFDSGSRHIPRILKSAFVFGPNASGKSNLIKAIDYAVSIVLGKRNPLSGRTVYFKLCPACPNKPSFIEFEMLIDKVMYRYGFKIQNEKITKEWLYKNISTGEHQIYVRKYTEKKKNTIEYGKNYQKYKEDFFFNFLLEGTPQEKLFLSETITRNREDFRDVYDWFKKIVIIYPESRLKNYNILIKSNELLKIYNSMLKRSDLGIESVDINLIDYDDLIDKVSPRFPRLKEILNGKGSFWLYSSFDKRYLIRLTDSKRDAYEISIKRSIPVNGQVVEFNINEESDGTNRMFDLIPIMELARNDSIILVDELHRSLHPLLIKFLVQEYFHANRKHRSQLVATTHDITLLNAKLLRRDSIWFTKKTREMASVLYSLVEYQKVRNDKVLNKAYLSGLYGAIPLIDKKG